MAIISAPVLLNAGQQVDHGFFCLGCKDGDQTQGIILRFRIKYTTEEMSEHIACHWLPGLPGVSRGTGPV